MQRKSFFLGLLFIALCPRSFASPLDLHEFALDLPSSGTFQIKIGWLYDETKAEQVLAGIIAFEPQQNAHICQDIRFIQVARVTDNRGQNLNWPGALSDRNKTRITSGEFVDSDNSHCQQGKSCSPYFNDSWPDQNYSHEGGVDQGVVQPAGMADFPFGWTEFSSIELESCAVCAADRFVFGCAKWGASWPEVGAPTIIKPSVASQPSVYFLRALEKFFAFYEPLHPTC